jgi:sortase A
MERDRTRRRWRWLERVLLVGGSLSLAAAGGMVAYGHVHEWIGRQEFAELTAGSASDTSEPGAAATAALRPVPRPREGALVGRIEIPRHGLSVLAREGVAEATLMKGAGHVPWTKLPGEPGNAVFLAHRDMHFRPLRAIEKGDLIWYTGLDRVQLYSVTETHVVEPGKHALLEPNTQDRLTLLTCYPFSYVGPAPLRFVVVARPVGEPRPLAATAAGDANRRAPPPRVAAR